MLVYLDMCCLKRPFDDQSQPRVRLESEAVLALLAMEVGTLQFVRSAALALENSHNPVKERAARVQLWLESRPLVALDFAAFRTRVSQLVNVGFKIFDAMHLATAEFVSADALATCDDRFLAAALRNQSALRIKVVSILDLAKEAGL